MTIRKSKRETVDHMNGRIAGLSRARVIVLRDLDPAMCPAESAETVRTIRLRVLDAIFDEHVAVLGAIRYAKLRERAASGVKP